MLSTLSYLTFCLLVAIYAQNKGRSSLKAFLVSLIFTPLVGFIVVLLLEESLSVKINRYHYEHGCKRPSLTDKIRNLQFLKQEGVLSEQEYQHQISKLRKNYFHASY
ncbi:MULTISPECIES: hypothetical protein [Persicobacter]|uniref:Uncharacterized protein n=1 Tax=Persicobacter diffluens TaxID=981 RepID=A0AAN4W0J9_9BACT|nr:hypothetical protein [Persicobacter sp. CCB-QB2]GJM62265.1 hypothetical protein PEDI_28170 [Persicobacter diffluens]